MTTDSSSAGDRPSISALLVGAGGRSNTQVEFFRSILNNVPAGIAILDGSELRLKWANQAYLDHLEGPAIGSSLPEGFLPSREVMHAVAKDAASYADPEFLYAHPTRGDVYWRLSM